MTKLDVDGDSLVYSTYLGGSGNSSGTGDGANAIAVDRHGNAYVTGLTSSPDFPTKNAFQEGLKGSINAFVTKLDADGDALDYSSYLGGSSTTDIGDTGNGIAVDIVGNAYVTGIASSTDFPIKNAFQDTFNGYEDGFVTKISAH